MQSCEVRLVRMKSTEDKAPLTVLSQDELNLNGKRDHDVDCDDVIPSSPPSNRRYGTRSSANGSNVMQTRTRPVREKAAPRPPPPKPRFIEYKGKVEYHTELHDIALMSHNLL